MYLKKEKPYAQLCNVEKNREKNEKIKNGKNRIDKTRSWCDGQCRRAAQKKLKNITIKSKCCIFVDMRNKCVCAVLCICSR